MYWGVNSLSIFPFSEVLRQEVGSQFVTNESSSLLNSSFLLELSSILEACSVLVPTTV